jgi:hypothetical protein
MSIVQIAECIRDLLRVVCYMRGRMRVDKYSSSPKAVVIGNGPSFADVIAMYPDGLQNHDIFCVNSFPKTDAFEIFKPRYCVFADPGYWALSASDALKQDRDESFSAIELRAKWEMSVLFPIAAKKIHKDSAFQFENPCVRILYYNSTTISDSLPIRLRSYFYRHNFAISGLQTVVCGCLSLAITMGYKCIYLVGADASFLEDVAMDDVNNVLVTKDCHYYDNGHEIPKPIYKDVNECVPFLVHEYLHAIFMMFYGYFECARFAQYSGVKIINSSSHSWIDSFPRGPLGDC